MKLAFVIFKYYPFGGLQRDCLRLAGYCQSKGHEVTVFTMDWQGALPDDISIRIVSPKGLSNSSRASNFSRAVQSLLKSYDRVIGFDRMQGLDFYFAGDLCFAETMRQKHGKWYQLTPRYRRFRTLEQQVFSGKSSAKIFVLTEVVKQSYQKIYQTPEDRFILVPPGIARQALSLDHIQNNKSKLKQKLQLQGPWTLLQVGSDFKRKGVERSLLAIASLPEDILKQTHYYCIGRGNAKKYLVLAKKLGIEKHIHFCGTQERIGDYMQAADLLLHPAFFETAGMVLPEALTQGLPVLVTENCGYALYIKEASAGSLVSSPWSQNEFNQKLLTMLNPDTLKTCSENAIAYAQTHDLYSMDEVCYGSLLSHKP